ncbi:MAG TPA: PIN domain-containing protein [Ktedonobacteraceae bacterium]|nr:PIN domain-containing protein [Ktedonobacteraceae bacterium]
MSFVVVLDACVLFPASLRDTLLRAAQADLYRMQLTEEILEEVRRNLVKKGMPEDKAQRLAITIREQFSDAFVTHHQPLITAMPNHEKDRHVLAAAVACKAHVIVTQNLRDFPEEILASFEIEAQSPDKFLVYLLRFHRESMVEILMKQAANLHSPSMTVFEVLDTLKLHVPIFAELARKELASPPA